MEINLTRVDQDYHFQARGAANVAINIDANPEIGGHNEGARPMELMLMGLGGCSAIDIISILKKQRQPIESFDINIKAERQKVEEFNLFSNIHIHFVLGGALDEEKVRKAIVLSLEKYCSVAAILYKTATITHSFELV
ncbi:OsmC family protein [Pontibacter sp. JH31]|uniref:OsmC family protein n=1 Tax=Pontibacter aquaedesilientis TaxID=2766980 RepID=A0ABR7XB53_9BACT|nr:OsmC family protein [Pontibacter aquaedesilientis]MBD1395541.1 OsmC family protein [Pontibacter aquaedesilientis]